MLQPSEELQEPSQPPFELFYCYAHEDQSLRDELNKHLTGLYRSKLIVSWYDGMIVPGAAWEQEIETHLNSAHIILLLVSPDFISSEYCYSKEMHRAIQRHKNHEARVIPILLRPVYWQDTPFSDLQMLPTGAKPVRRWDDKDAAFEDVTQGIRHVITKLSAQRLQQENKIKAVLEQQNIATLAPPITSQTRALNDTQHATQPTFHIEKTESNEKVSAPQQQPDSPTQVAPLAPMTPHPQQNILSNNQLPTQQENKAPTPSTPGNVKATFHHITVEDILIPKRKNIPTKSTITSATAKATKSTSSARQAAPSPSSSAYRFKQNKLQFPKRRTLFFVMMALLSAVIPLLLLGSGTLLTSIVSAPGNTVTITPDGKEVQDGYVIQAVTNQPNADQLQVGMRNLSVAPDAQNKTVVGTGHGQIPAVRARGRLTFINGSSYPYTVASGTVISAPTGVSVVTEQPAAIPAGIPGGANGSVSVPAHAVSTGTIGNLDQGSINKICCSTGASILVRNDVAFTGGVDAQTYTFVRQEDIDADATPLETTLSQHASTQFKQQLKPNEKLVGDPTCNSNVQGPPEKVGDQGHNTASTTITVTAKCTGMAYDQGAAQAIAKDRLQKKANIDPGQGYSLVGNIVTDVTISKVNPDSISLLVSARGIWAYQLDDAKKWALTRWIAGKKVSEVLSSLKAQHGIHNVKIDVKGDTLPTNPNQIALVFQKIAGENVSNGGGNTLNGTPTPVTGEGLIPSDRLKTTYSI